MLLHLWRVCTSGSQGASGVSISMEKSMYDKQATKSPSIAAELLMLLLSPLFPSLHRIRILSSVSDNELLLRITSSLKHYKIVLVVSLFGLQAQALSTNITENASFLLGSLHFVYTLAPLPRLQLVFAQQEIVVLPDRVLRPRPSLFPTMVPRRLFDWSGNPIRTIPRIV